MANGTTQFRRCYKLLKLIFDAALLAHKQMLAKEIMFINLIIAILVFVVGTIILMRVLPLQVRYVQASYNDGEWLKVSLPLLFIAGMYLILNRTDIIMLGVMLGTDEAGIYSVSSRLADFVTFGVIAVESIAAPIISELYSKSQQQRLQRVTTLATRGMSVFSFVTSIGMVVLGNELLGLFGEGFVTGYMSLLVLVVGRIVISVVGPVGFLMSMTGHEIQMASIAAVAAVMNAIMNAILIPILGMVGAAVSTSLTTSLLAIAMLFYVWRRLKINPTVLAVSIP